MLNDLQYLHQGEKAVIAFILVAVVLLLWLVCWNYIKGRIYNRAYAEAADALLDQTGHLPRPPQDPRPYDRRSRQPAGWNRECC